MKGLGPEGGGEHRRPARKARRPRDRPSGFSSPTCCRSPRSLAADLLDHPASDAVAVAGSARRLGRDLQGRRPDRHRERSRRSWRTALVEHPLAAASGNPGVRVAQVTTQNGVSDRPSDRRAGGLRQPTFSTSPARRRTTSSFASARSSMGLSVSEHGITDRRVRQGRPASRPKRRSTSASASRYIEPELRQARGEIKASRDGELPELVDARTTSRGDLHSHTTLSDGKNDARGDGRSCRERSATPTSRSPTTRPPTASATT